MPRNTDSVPLDVPVSSVADLQLHLIGILRQDIRDFQAGKIDRCLTNAESVLALRKAIKALDPLASLYWSIRP